MISSLFVTLARLLGLRAGPQDLPASWRAGGLMISLYVAADMYTGLRLGNEGSIIQSLAINTLQFSAVAVILYVRKYPERLAQTLCALAGAGFLLGLPAFALLSQVDPNANQPLLGLAWFGLVAWSLAIDAHIFRHALAITMPQGLLVAVLLMAASYVLVEVVF